ncbi:hypothetical protein ACVI1I_004522 [Bradyrhizobium sp. USDA 4459]
MAVPSHSSAIGVLGRPAVTSASPTIRSFSPGPSATMQSLISGQAWIASRAMSSFAADVIKIFDWLLTRR